MQALGHLTRASQITLRQNQGKLFAPITGHQIAIASQTGLGNLGQMDETAITGRVTKGIVKLLEMIDIKQNEGDRLMHVEALLA